MINNFFHYRSSCRYCRVGSGEENTVGKNDTPGFEYCSHDKIKFDSRNFNFLQLKRTNSTRFLQSSMTGLQSWRVNMDVKVLIYDTDPDCPDMFEISTVSDYIVSYT